MNSKISIYHNPRCRKSREALDYLNNSDIDYNLVLYLSNPLSKITLENLLFKLKINAIDLVRKNELLWKSEFSKKNLTENEIISIMLENPKLIERPIIENENSAVIGRPIEKLHDFLNKIFDEVVPQIKDQYHLEIKFENGFALSCFYQQIPIDNDIKYI